MNELVDNVIDSVPQVEQIDLNNEWFDNTNTDLAEMLERIEASIIEDNNGSELADEDREIPELEKLDDEMDVLITPKELVSDKGIDWQTFVDEDVPLIKIRKENVTDVNTDGFEDMQEKLELITAELNRKDAEWKRTWDGPSVS